MSGRGSVDWLLVALLLSSLTAPLVNASGSGGALIDVDSIAITGDGEVGAGEAWVNLTVSELDGGDSNTTLVLELRSIEGDLIGEDNQSLSLTDGQSVTVSFHLGAVPVGSHSLFLTLSGEVGTPGTVNGTQYAAAWNSSITRLRPLSVGLAPTGQWSLTPLDASGTPTGSALRHADNLTISVPVENNGDVGAVGNISASYTPPAPGSTIVNLGPFSINSSADTTADHVFDLGVVNEGEFDFEVTLDFAGDPPGDDVRTLAVIVAPPPLPELVLTMSDDPVDSASSAAIGDSITFNISAENRGEEDWSGYLICTHPDNLSILHNESLSLNIGGTWSGSITMTASPGNTECSLLGGGRITDNSSAVTSHLFDMPSGDLGMAGGGGLILAGGPWHVGDTITASVLVHNSGEKDATARLVLGEDSAETEGEEVLIDSGGSAELVADLPLTNDGQITLDWRVSSSDSLVSSLLRANTSLDVGIAQGLAPSVESVTWDAADGVSIVWSVHLSEGNARRAVAEMGFRIDGIEDVRSSIELDLTPGRRVMTTELGPLSGQGEAFVRITPTGWTASGPLENTLTIPAERPILSVVQSEIVSPTRPLPGSSATVICNIHNDGEVQSDVGILRLLDSSGSVLAEQTTTRLGPTSSGTSNSMQVTWPSGKVVDLTCWWRVSDVVYTSDGSHFSGDVVNSGASTWQDSIPYVDIGIGVVIACVLMLATRLIHTWVQTAEQEGGSAPKSRAQKRSSRKAAKSKPTVATPSSDDEKREVACSACDQRLAVPFSFTGTVRCPACKHEFNVEAAEPQPVTEEYIPQPVTEDEAQPETELEEDLIPTPIVALPEEEEELVVRSMDDILQCPSCDSKLRVGIEKRPARARCPACKQEFLAEVG